MQQSSCFSAKRPTRFHCRMCDKTYPRKVSLRHHMSTHSSYKPHKCAKCNLSFHRKDVVTKHVKIHSERKITCMICGSKFVENSSLRIHLHNVHSVSPFKKQPKRLTYRHRYKCYLCNRRYTVMASLQYHLKTHLSVKQHGCRLCNKFFFTKSMLLFHMKIHTGKETSCRLCSQKFVTLQYLRDHFKKVHMK